MFSIPIPLCEDFLLSNAFNSIFLLLGHKVSVFVCWVLKKTWLVAHLKKIGFLKLTMQQTILGLWTNVQC